MRRSLRPLVLSFLLLLVPSTTWSQPAAKSLAGGGAPATTDVRDPLKVTGQTRNLNMVLTLQSKDERLKFIKIRKDYRAEILGTPY